MIIARSEKVTLPNTDDGKFMADQYADDMRNAGMEVYVKTKTEAITVNGHFIGDLEDKFVSNLKERMRK